jgi:GntR family transcriptional regulator, transcriptional repressor for pyruvate dehydrogenase complex
MPRTSEPLSPDTLGPLDVPAAYEVVADRLRRAIHLGVFTQGERLPPERELAERLDVSRVTLRAALKTLEGAGYLVRRRGNTGGTEVAPSAPAGPGARAELLARLAESAVLVEYRAIVESSAARLAAQRRGPDSLRLIEQACADLDQVDSISTFRRADNRFHLLIAEAAGNPMLAQAVTDAREGMFAWIDVLPYRVIVGRTQADHRAVYEAIAAGQGDRAAERMAAHVQASFEELQQVLGERR